MKCSFCERTDDLCKIKTIKGKHYCPKHLSRHYRKQDMNKTSIYDENEYIIESDVAKIVLRDLHGEVAGEAVIDIDDVNRCKKYKWHIRSSKGRTKYVVASLPENEKIHLHRFIIGYDGPLDVDHINRNGLDNRKANLRIVTHAENTANNANTGIRKTEAGRYIASCCRNYKTHYIGTYDNYDEAVAARAAFIKQYNSVGH